jgi:ubiquinone/menaquinone biosynthesis C-methylase UbiE
VFDAVADYYDRARPSYPPGIYDALADAVDGLYGTRVVDVGAGTGIASRQLLARGARVVAIDKATQMIARARASAPTPACVVGDGNELPLGTSTVRLACFAQAWHWFDTALAAREVARVLECGGCWAAWWSHARADGEPWFDAYQDLLERRCPGYLRQRDTGNQPWSAEPIAATALFTPGQRHLVAWVRALTCERWMTEVRSKSYVGALDAEARDLLLADVLEIIAAQFPGGHMVVPYTTHMWIARRR